MHLSFTTISHTIRILDPSLKRVLLSTPELQIRSKVCLLPFATVRPEITRPWLPSNRFAEPIFAVKHARKTSFTATTSIFASNKHDASWGEKCGVHFEARGRRERVILKWNNRNSFSFRLSWFIIMHQDRYKISKENSADFIRTFVWIAPQKLNIAAVLCTFCVLSYTRNNLQTIT